MRPRRPVALVLVVLVVGTTGAVTATGGSSVAGVVGSAGGVDAPSHPPREATVLPSNRSVPDNGSVVMRIAITPDGDARWTVASGFALPNETDVAAFRSLVDDVRNGTAPAGMVGYSADDYRNFAERVERSLNRSAEMRIENPRWNGRVVNGTGVLSLSFTWTDFARKNGNRVILGDVFETGEGWFSGLEDNQRLVIDAPSGYGLDSSGLDEPFDNGTFFIDGPVNLSNKDVSIVYEPTLTPTLTRTPTATRNGTTPNGPSGSGVGVFLFGGLLALALVAALVAYVVSTDPFGDGGAAAPDESTDGSSGSSAETAHGSATNDDTSPETAAPPPTEGGPTTDPVEGTGTAKATAEGSADDGSTAAGGEEGDADAIDAELLSDEERVERLLEANGGRMKQANIVTETGWSNAKVSQLLSSMDEDDRIDKLRIGRENLITLPDENADEIE